MSGANDTKIQWLRAGSSTLWSVLSTLGPGGHGQTRARAREGQKGAPGRSKWGAFGVFFEKNQKIPKIKKTWIFSCFSSFHFFMFFFFFIFHFFYFFFFFMFSFFQCSLQNVITSSFFSFPIVWWAMWLNMICFPPLQLLQISTTFMDMVLTIQVSITTRC